jgi:hypothetical protein
MMDLLSGLFKIIIRMSLGNYHHKIMNSELKIDFHLQKFIKNKKTKLKNPKYKMKPFWYKYLVYEERLGNVNGK